MSEAYPIALFSYGTLQLEHIQMKNFGRLLQGADDILTGFKMESFEIADRATVQLIGQSTLFTLVESGNAKDEVRGKVFYINEKELLAADDYEEDDYRRVEVVLKSGTKAWVYVKADS